MKKYLGSKITMFAGIVWPCFIVGSLVFSVIILKPRIDTGRLLIALYFIFISVVCTFALYKVSMQLYSWGNFRENSIEINTLLSKKHIEIEYAKCRSIGIGLYVHGVLNSNVGSKMKFIYFSYEAFDEKYRFNINLWKPSSTRIKVEFDKKLYDYLLTVLPKQQANWLKRDYEKYA